MAPPPLESPHAPAEHRSPLTSANTRLTEPREIGSTVTRQPGTDQIVNSEGGIECRLDTASQLHTKATLTCPACGREERQDRKTVVD